MVPVIIIIMFDENNVLGTIHIYQYISISGWAGVLHGSPYIFCLLFIKRKKYKKSMTYTKIKFYIIFIFKNIS